MEAVVIEGLPGLLGALLDCAEDALDPTPGRVLVAPGGEVAWDACCDGQLWVRVVEVTDATDLLGIRVGADGSCQTAAWRVDIGVGVLRCTPTVDDRGRAPSADDLTGRAVVGGYGGPGGRGRVLRADRAAARSGVVAVGAGGRLRWRRVDFRCDPSSVPMP